MQHGFSAHATARRAVMSLSLAGVYCARTLLGRRVFQAKRAKHSKVSYFRTTASIANKFCTVIKTASTLCGWSKYARNKSKMAAAGRRHLEKSKIVIYQKPFD